MVKSNEGRFPKISTLASNVLAMKAPSVASEATFSRPGIVVGENCTRLCDESVQASIPIKYRSKYFPC